MKDLQNAQENDPTPPTDDLEFVLKLLQEDPFTPREELTTARSSKGVA